MASLICTVKDLNLLYTVITKMTTAEQINVHDTDADTTTIDSPSPLPQHLTHIPRPFTPNPTKFALHTTHNYPSLPSLQHPYRRPHPPSRRPPRRCPALQPTSHNLAQTLLHLDGLSQRLRHQGRQPTPHPRIRSHHHPFIDYFLPRVYRATSRGRLLSVGPRTRCGVKENCGGEEFADGGEGESGFETCEGEGIVGVTDVTKCFVMVKAALERGDLETAGVEAC
ncbi:hypothetical protein BC829DRAFT_245120 [Chytridium lagenaria]|nr:hypothetical protein BC829DRAFT_245120 [Chytridium lagenaria]